jgi:hypothetical protein
MAGPARPPPGRPSRQNTDNTIDAHTGDDLPLFAEQVARMRASFFLQIVTAPYLSVFLAAGGLVGPSLLSGEGTLPRTLSEWPCVSRHALWLNVTASLQSDIAVSHSNPWYSCIYR